MEQMELKARVDALRTVNPGLSIRAACVAAGVDPANYRRWQKLAENGGPREGKKKGRPVKWEWTQSEALLLKWYLGWTESFTLAVEYLIEYGTTGASPLPACPHPRPSAEFAEALQNERRRGGRWDTRLPKSLRSACRLTAAERALIRGEKAYNNESLSVRRLMVVRDFCPVTGAVREFDMWAGCGYCSDDVSPEQPFTSDGPEGERVNRQTLATHDVYSRRWLGVLAVARPGDAYTKVDQADHIASVIHESGLPYYWVFERGPWANTFIDGIRLPSGWADEETVWGGLSGLFRVRHAFKPQTKTVEGAFATWQRRMRGRATSVGAESRGARMEKATNLMTAAQAGKEDALRLFWDMAEGTESFWQQMEAINAREQRREFLNGGMASPDALWAQTYQRRPLAASDAWMLLPIKETRVITKQRISVTLKGYGTYDFACVCQGELPLLDNGHRLLCAFHPDKPEEGARIFNGDLRAEFNRDGMKLGEAIGTARYLPAVPMADFTGTGDHTAQRRARAAVRSELRAAKATIGGVVRESRRADGMGNALRISTGGSEAPAPALPVPPRATTRSIFSHLPAEEPAETAPADVEAFTFAGDTRPPADVWEELTA